jgi:hypothetical protein
VKRFNISMDPENLFSELQPKVSDAAEYFSYCASALGAEFCNKCSDAILELRRSFEYVLFVCDAKNLRTVL